MNEPKHTLGPWAWREDRDGHPVALWSEDGFVLIPQVSFFVPDHVDDLHLLGLACFKLGGNDSREWLLSDADAALIAAAPELLAMCKAVRDWDRPWDGFVGDSGEKINEQLEVIIAKAEGAA